jgi:hypothetical protein
MKRGLVKLGSVVAIAAAALGLGTQVSAGLRDLRQVYAVRYSNGTVYGDGSVSGARYSADAVQWIGCSNYTFSSGSPNEYLSCSAKNAAGAFVSCTILSSDAGFWALRDAVALVSTNSHISFNGNASGKCTSISVQDFSYSIP